MYLIGTHIIPLTGHHYAHQGIIQSKSYGPLLFGGALLTARGDSVWLLLEARSSKPCCVGGGRLLRTARTNESTPLLARRGLVWRAPSGSGVADADLPDLRRCFASNGRRIFSEAFLSWEVNERDDR